MRCRWTAAVAGPVGLPAALQGAVAAAVASAAVAPAAAASAPAPASASGLRMRKAVVALAGVPPLADPSPSPRPPMMPLPDAVVGAAAGQAGSLRSPRVERAAARRTCV
jgi:hypothetical protein